MLIYYCVFWTLGLVWNPPDCIVFDFSTSHAPVELPKLPRYLLLAHYTDYRIVLIRQLVLLSKLERAMDWLAN